MESIIISFLDVEAIVDLPEDLRDCDGLLTPEARERAIEAAVNAVPQSVDIYFDGEDNRQ